MEKAKNIETYQLEIEGARFYEQHFIPSIFQRWAQITVNKLELQESHKLLDVACGTGIVARTAHSSGILNIEVTGYDLNPGMLQVASEMDAKINWVSGNAEKLPFKTSTFDRVVCQFAVMFFQNRISAVNEMLRVKKATGKVVMVVWDQLEKNTLHLKLMQLIQEIGGEKAASIFAAPFNFGNKAEITQMIESSEARDYTIETIVENVEFPSIKNWIECEVKASPIMDVLSEDQYLELADRSNVEFKKFVNNLGVLRFPMSAHLITIT